ncbi:hypothetical protein GGR57DRAFT_519193 [Xylariaceae sp. FL1272]|nr:hypothetical protein GGR57DRAFT_519193 [Xylariaceae sp. FL1272]
MFGQFQSQVPPRRQQRQSPPSQIPGWVAGMPSPNLIPVNGMNKVVISVQNRDRTVNSPMIPLQPDKDRRFLLLASAVNRGLEWHETAYGRSTLRKLGRFVLDQFRLQIHPLPRPIDHSQIGQLVYYFLIKMREGFPPMWIASDLPSGSLAAAEKFQGVPGLDLYGFRPHTAMAMFSNEQLVNMMAKNDDEFWRPKGGREKQRDYDNTKARAGTRHHRFQFLFAVATWHEMGHCFVAMLAQNPSTLTPPDVTYLDYAQTEDAGESGHWAESIFFGGSIEAFYDPRDGLEHLYILKPDDTVRQILPQVIREFMGEARRVHAAPSVAADPITRAQRKSRGFRPLGQNDLVSATPAAVRTMIAMRDLQRAKRYHVRIQELRMLPSDPRVSVVAVSV